MASGRAELRRQLIVGFTTRRVDQPLRRLGDLRFALLQNGKALKAVNPNIRDDELAAIESNRQQVLEALGQAGWRSRSVTGE
jgi:hypothetical protein